jgi:plastocyanin
VTKKTLLLIFLAAVPTIAFVVFLISKQTPGQPTRNDTPPPPAVATVTVQMTPEGFSPSKITFRPGTAVKFANQDSRPRWPASNIHPSHDIFPEFDPKKPVAPQQEWTFLFDREGIWRYHDHILPDLVGTITVE